MSKDSTLFPEIEALSVNFDFTTISDERKEILQPLVDFIQAKADANQDIRLNLICTHNSRRSHLAQIWAQAAALNYDIPKVTCYSGGTEATAMYPKVVETLTQAGLRYKSSLRAATLSMPLNTRR